MHRHTSTYVRSWPFPSWKQIASATGRTKTTAWLPKWPPCVVNAADEQSSGDQPTELPDSLVMDRIRPGFTPSESGLWFFPPVQKNARVPSGAQGGV